MTRDPVIPLSRAAGVTRDPANSQGHGTTQVTGVTGGEGYGVRSHGATRGHGVTGAMRGHG